ncbi:MAG TPA: helix-turn-helix domain-containing protein [Dehalococcoidia bacterium]|jgi:transcriptional regulator with XRE-family HTH domain
MQETDQNGEATGRDSDLGGYLRLTRTLVGLSLRKAAAKAGVSAAYLSQLEAGAVREPSPRVLYGLAKAYASGLPAVKASIRIKAVGEQVKDEVESLGLPSIPEMELPTEVDELYAVLMQKAGYPMPRPSDVQVARMRMRSPMEAVLRSSAPLTPDEIDALTEYLAWYRSRHGRRIEEKKG